MSCESKIWGGESNNHKQQGTVTKGEGQQDQRFLTFREQAWRLSNRGLSGYDNRQFSRERCPRGERAPTVSVHQLVRAEKTSANLGVRVRVKDQQRSTGGKGGAQGSMVLSPRGGTRDERGWREKKGTEKRAGKTRTDDSVSREAAQSKRLKNIRRAKVRPAKLLARLDELDPA